MATSRNDARATLLTLVASMFDKVADHADSMPIETRTERTVIHEMIGIPGEQATINDPNGALETYQGKDKATGAMVAKTRPAQVPQVDSDGNPVLQVGPPDLTVMILRALETTGETVFVGAGRNAGLWKGRVSKSVAKPGETVAKYKDALTKKDADHAAEKIAMKAAFDAMLREELARITEELAAKPRRTK